MFDILRESRIYFDYQFKFRPDYFQGSSQNIHDLKEESKASHFDLGNLEFKNKEPGEEKIESMRLINPKQQIEQISSFKQLNEKRNETIEESKVNGPEHVIKYATLMGKPLL